MEKKIIRFFEPSVAMCFVLMLVFAAVAFLCDQYYLAACEAGVDEEFGKDAKYLKPVTGAPYYGIVGSSWCYSTCGGLDVNEQFQVLREDGQPFEGLYAVGTDSMGVLFSETKAYVTYGGGAMGYAFTSGRLVGQSIADAIK